MKAHSASPASRTRVADLPELNVAIFSFLLNFMWEFFQVPFFRGMATAPHVCIRATFGDAVIALMAFWAMAVAVRSRTWILRPSPRQMVGFVAVGVGITILFEWLATVFCTAGHTRTGCRLCRCWERGSSPSSSGSSCLRSSCGSSGGNSPERDQARRGAVALPRPVEGIECS